MKMTLTHIRADPQNDHRPRLRPSCRPMPWETTLAGSRIVVETVRRHDLAAVPVDMDRAFVGRGVEGVADHGVDAVRRRRPGARRHGVPEPFAVGDRTAVSRLATLRPAVPRLGARHLGVLPCAHGHLAGGCAAATRRGWRSDPDAAPGSVLHIDDPWSVASCCTFSPQKPVHGRPDTRRQQAAPAKAPTQPVPVPERDAGPAAARPPAGTPATEEEVVAADRHHHGPAGAELDQRGRPTGRPSARRAAARRSRRACGRGRASRAPPRRTG